MAYIIKYGNTDKIVWCGIGLKKACDYAEQNCHFRVDEWAWGKYTGYWHYENNHWGFIKEAN